MAPHAKAAGQVQGIHSLGLKLSEHGAAHGLQLLVQFVAELEGRGRTISEELPGAGGHRGVLPVLGNIWTSGDCASVL